MPTDLFGPELWADVGRKLRGGALAWWRTHRDTIENLTHDEVVDIAGWLRAGNRTQAKLVLYRRMTRAEWIEARDGTLANLSAIAARRVAAIAALRQLGAIMARIVGGAILGAVGL